MSTMSYIRVRVSEFYAVQDYSAGLNSVLRQGV